MGARPRPAVLLLAGSLLLVSCAAVRNFLDPAGPRYAGQHASAPEMAPESIKVVSFNVKYARRVDRAIALLKEDPSLRGADIIALQEMNDTGTEAIARALGLNYVYYPGAHHPKSQGLFGNALLSRWPLESDRKVVFPHPGRFRKMIRIAVGADVLVGPTRIRTYSVHLETPFAISDAQRRAQIDAVVADAGDEPRVLIAGDFNNRDVAGRHLQARGFRWLTRTVRSTIQGFAWDHLFVRGLASRDNSFGRTAKSGGASDHRPVWVELDLGRAP